jgi:hypothetical protein
MHLLLCGTRVRSPHCHQKRLAMRCLYPHSRQLHRRVGRCYAGRSYASLPEAQCTLGAYLQTAQAHMHELCVRAALCHMAGTEDQAVSGCT